MSNPNVRGGIIFAIMIAAAWFFCGVLPTTIMPNNGIAMALPVIQVPGEVFVQDWPSADFEFTNTLVGMLIADGLVILIALLGFQVSKGWTNENPGRFQGMVEVLVDGLYGLVKSMAGTATIVRTQLFPLVASIFFFLLMANWVELIPGVDSIGLMHCAQPGMNGYGRNGNILYNEDTLFVGYDVETEHQYEMCELYLEGHFTGPLAADMTADDLHVEQAALEEEIAAIAESDPAHAHTLELELVSIELRIEAVEEVHALETEMAAAGITDETVAEIDAKVDAGEELNAEEQEILDLEANLALAKTQVQYPGAMFALSDEQLEAGVQPYAFIVTPFVRAAATDMNLTFGLAIISILAIQYFGIKALGIAYFQKFVNIKALGNAGKNPMGIMDFGVGLFEIVSEFAKMISLAFRLFGNIFAGQLLLFIITFLVATLLPVAVYGLEFAVGFIQALVFGMLTLVFAAGAMVSHDHDDHDEEHH